VVLGIELRLLSALGSLPDLADCSTCGRPFAGQAFHGEVAGALACREHASAPRRAIGSQTLEHLRTLLACPGRELPAVPTRPTAAAVALPALWLARSLERRCSLRQHVFARGTAVDAKA
jgi:recombinational DNA repair protein (RecF pathway)